MMKTFHQSFAVRMDSQAHSPMDAGLRWARVGLFVVSRAGGTWLRIGYADISLTPPTMGIMTARGVRWRMFGQSIGSTNFTTGLYIYYHHGVQMKEI